MESFTHESDDSSSCTQSDGDSTNSSNGTNPFLLCPRENSLHSRGHGRLHDSTEDIRPYKLARMEPSSQLQYHASALTNSQGVTTMSYPHNVTGEIQGPDGVHRSALLSQGRSYTSSPLEDCRGLPSELASIARTQHAGLPYLGATHNFLAQDQWSGLRQQGYVLNPVATGNAPSSTLLLPMACKVDKMPINFGNTAGSFYLGLTDPQPGRCRRTDGKKWRCGRAVVPEQKYCERHMHRGRGRSKAAKLAKVTTAIDTNQQHGLGRPLNQPLIHLLSQLTVPGQTVVNQPPEAGLQPTSAVQPLKWLQKSTQTFHNPHAHFPYPAQPLLVEQLGQFPIQSKALDWSINQLPMQAEPLHLGQSNGRSPVLAQAIPVTAGTEVKVRPECGTGLAVTDPRRMHSDDPNDVLNLDVQGIKRLLENAPCSRRSSSSLHNSKQLPNKADLLNVARIGNVNIEPKRPPSLMDVLKMVDPFTSGIATNSVPSLSHLHPPSTAQASGIMPTSICQADCDSPEIGNSGALLSLKWSDSQTPEKQNKQQQPNLPSSLDIVTEDLHNEMLPLKLFKETSDGSQPRHTQGNCLQPLDRDDAEMPLPISTDACMSGPGHQIFSTPETKNGRQHQDLLKQIESCGGTPVISAKTVLNLMEDRSRDHSRKGVVQKEDGNFNPVAGLHYHKYPANLDINSSTQADVVFNSPGSLMVRENSLTSTKVTSNHQETSPRSDSDSLVLLECSLDSHDSSEKSEEFFPRLVEKGPDQRLIVESMDVNSPISRKKRINHHENCANLDMNSPTLVANDEQPGSGKPLKASPSSTQLIENLPKKVALDRSSSGSSCNASSLSKSTLSLDPAAVSNLEPSSHVSLTN